MKDVIEVLDLNVEYDVKLALCSANFTIPKGVCCAIVGPNGAGKTSLLKAMIGAIEGTSGEVRYFGKMLKEMKGAIAYVGQKSQVDWQFPITVIEVVLMGAYGKLGLFKRPGKADKAKAKALLEKFDMEEYAHKQIGELSGGQQQRVFIMRALMQEAEVFFFDEPFNNIDVTTEKLIVECFKELKALGKTIFVVHHDLSTVEKYFDWLILLNTRIIAFGNVSEVYTERHLAETFGQKNTFFEEALKRKEEKTRGLT